MHGLSFEKNGVVWRPGLRVTTRCVLAGWDKSEYAAGLPGTVYEILEDEVMIVCIDNGKCALQLTKAEPQDLVAHGALPPKTPVGVHQLELVLGARRRLIENNTPGVLESYSAKSNTYRMKFAQSRCRADIPAQMVMPQLEVEMAAERGGEEAKRPLLSRLPVPGTAIKKALSRLSRLGSGGKKEFDERSRQETSDTLMSTYSEPWSEVAEVEPSQCAPRSRSRSPAAAQTSPGLSPESPPLGIKHKSSSILNLSKKPTYSNIAGSPTAAGPKVSARGPLRRGDSNNTSVSWELDDQMSRDWQHASLPSMPSMPMSSDADITVSHVESFATQPLSDPNSTLRSASKTGRQGFTRRCSSALVTLAAKNFHDRRQIGSGGPAIKLTMT
eukprot:TRINITY_DN1038_c0_g4_i1.p1 TRINITY_DN1038_c0_g4~~TRINITY_DN1038_c0_g4_i1.p1  ORF type:complete len:386 (+),score=70.30 TRINITY_DN1038_c0_g4_i1:69-1226(+)